MLEHLTDTVDDHDDHACLQDLIEDLEAVDEVGPILDEVSPDELAAPTQIQLANATADFIQKIGFLPEKDAQGNVVPGKTRTASFTFDRPSQDRSSPNWSDRLHGEHSPTFADRCLDRLG